MDDFELLRQFAADGSEAAFTALVERHLRLVHAAAWRQARDAHLAGEITQAVFILLARKAKTISRKTILTGWLYRTTHFVAADALKAQRRRQWREHQAARMQTDFENAASDAVDSAWEQIAPHLDEAMAKLGGRDRDAVLLRFFEDKSFAQVGAALGVNEDAARKRIVRALEKLRRHFYQRGVLLTATLIAGAVSTHSVHAAPAISAKTISAVALAKGAAAGGSTLTLAKGALKLMAWTKAKTAIVAGVVVLLAVGTTTVTVKEIQKSKLDNAWRVRFYNPQLLEQAPPQVRILPSKFPPGGMGYEKGAWMGIGESVDTIIYEAYSSPAWRTKILTKLPVGHFDFIAKLPDDSKSQEALQALQKEIKSKFDLVGHLEMQNADVLLLAVKNPDANGLKIHDPQIVRSYYRAELGKISLINRPFHEFSDYLEGVFQMPIVNGTDIKGNVDVTLNWNRKDWEHPNLDGLKQALLDQLGLELVPTNMPIEMLVVEKAP
jgi:uncharacterized protein (TIGR03435 family)